MPGQNERARFLKAKVPDGVEFTLGKVLGSNPSKLEKMIGGASLIVVRSQEIDSLGEADEDLGARQVMGSILDNIARAVKKLARLGIENFVVTADHGHLFSIRKEEDMRIDSPGGNMLDSHRRCWIGHGGTTPPGTVRITGAELGYATDLDFVFPTGLGVFRAGGGLSYHHGGLSLQEMIVPVLSFRIPTAKAQTSSGAPIKLVSLPEMITNRTFGVRLLTEPDIMETEPRPFRVVLISEGEQVGQVGMALGADLDRATGILRVSASRDVSVGLMLTRDDCQTVRVVVQDPITDAVFAQSPPIPVKLGI